MKKIILTLAIAVTAFSASYAQKGNKSDLTPEQRAEKVASNLKTKLSLTDDQKSKVYQIEVDKIKKAQEWRKENHEAMKSKNGERQDFMKQNEEKLEKVLTTEQRKTYEAMREERKSKMRSHRGDHQHKMKADTTSKS